MAHPRPVVIGGTPPRARGISVAHASLATYPGKLRGHRWGQLRCIAHETVAWRLPADRYAVGMSRTLYYGDNLDILKCLPAESVDLVYLDPPFNSNADYNVIFREHKPDARGPQAQIAAFEDTWQWGNEAASTLADLASVHGELAELLDAVVRRLGHNSLSAYLVMMAPRLAELHRVLKATGSLYLHCDPTASHHLKVLLDAVFGPTRFLNEIVWKRSSAHSDAKQGRRQYGRIHDTILFYSKGAEWTWNPIYTPYDDDYVEQFYRHVEPRTGRRYQMDNLTAAKPGGDTTYEWRVKRRTPKGSEWMADLEGEYQHPKRGWEYRGVPPYAGRIWAYSRENMERFAREGRLAYTSSGMPRYKRYLDEMPGVVLQDVWTDISPLAGQSAERLGYPTQKPVALLERIIRASSNEGDVVLDPFCGCGTAIAAAERLCRSWIGIDVTHLAVSLIEARLRRDFGLESGKDYALEGTPKDVEAARYLFNQGPDGPYQFQFWVNGLIGAQSYGAGPTGKGKKGGDTGIDGKMYFRTPGGEQLEKVIVSVKGGKSLNPGMVRDLESVVRREKAALGVFVSLEKPTGGMYTEAATHGFYDYAGDKIPTIQLITVDELLAGKRPEIPAGATNVSFDARPTKSARTDKKDPTRRDMPGLFDSSK